MDKTIVERNARWLTYIWLIVTVIMVVHISIVVAGAIDAPEEMGSPWRIGFATLAMHALPEGVALAAMLYFRKKLAKMEKEEEEARIARRKRRKHKNKNPQQ